MVSDSLFSMSLLTISPNEQIITDVSALIRNSVAGAQDVAGRTTSLVGCNSLPCNQDQG